MNQSSPNSDGQNLKGKVALVTGAGRGIGKGCALALARKGADLLVNDRPGSPDLAATIDELRKLGVRAEPLESDVFQRAGCELMIEEAIGLAGRIDILVSNPAASFRCPFLEYDPHEFERIINGALISGFHVSQLVARHMVRQNQGGKITFISSVHADRPYADSVAYNAAKAGLNHMARTIAIELAPHKINVNVIEPGWIDTPGEHLVFNEETIRAEGEKLPWKRLGTPDDIGNAAAFLSSPEADYVTGSTLRVDGAFVIRDCGHTFN